MNPDSERALARVALEMHGGSGLRVLVGGQGWEPPRHLSEGRVDR